MGEWISVDDKMPAPYARCRVKTAQGREGVMFITWTRCKGESLRLFVNGKWGEVTHWIPADGD